MILFLVGFVSGVVSTLLYASYKVAQYNKKDDKLIEGIKKDLDLAVSVKKRFARVTQITSEQMELLANAERPSASATHSKYQNSIVSELKKLEKEKMDIFRSILKDGVDPKLSVIADGKPTVMKMSEAVSLYDSHQSPSDFSDSKNPRVRLRLVRQEDMDVQDSKEKPSS